MDKGGFEDQYISGKNSATELHISTSDKKSNKVLSINKKLQILRTSTDCDDIRKQVLTIILANHFELALPLLATISGKVGLTVTMFRNFTSE